MDLIIYGFESSELISLQFNVKGTDLKADLEEVNGFVYSLMSRERIYRPIWKK